VLKTWSTRQAELASRHKDLLEHRQHIDCGLLLLSILLQLSLVALLRHCAFFYSFTFVFFRSLARRDLQAVTLVLTKSAYLLD
jgi:hypothetical protein